MRKPITVSRFIREHRNKTGVVRIFFNGKEKFVPQECYIEDITPTSGYLTEVTTGNTVLLLNRWNDLGTDSGYPVRKKEKSATLDLFEISFEDGSIGVLGSYKNSPISFTFVPHK